MFGAAVDVRYLPYDTVAAVARFLDRIDPELGVIVETELWPNLFAGCARRGVPLLLASARISAKSTARYQGFAGVFAGILGNVTVAAQTRTDAERFIALGAELERTHVVGNVKFDIELAPALLEQGRLLRARTFGSRPVWVAGSTHAGEEEAALEAHRPVFAATGALLVLAPRHPNRFEAVAALLRRVGGKVLSSNPSSYIVELTSTEAEIGEFIANVGAFGHIGEVVRSGVLGISRANPRLHVVR